MSRELQVRSATALPVVDTANPVSMSALPAWLARLTASVSDLGSSRIEMDPQTGQPARRVSTLPASLMPSGPQRAAIADRVTHLRAASYAGPIEAIAKEVGELLIERTSYRLDAKTTDAKTTGYLTALHDLPAWAVAEAVRRWRCGEAGDDIPPGDYEFMPSTARLRRISQRIAMAAEGQAIRLQRILDAEPDMLPSPSQREDNARRMEQAASDIKAAASVASPKPGGRTPAEQDAVSLAEAARWQRWCATNIPQEEQSNA